MKERDGFDDHGSDSNRELSVAIQLGLLVDHQALEANGEAVGQVAEPKLESNPWFNLSRDSNPPAAKWSAQLKAQGVTNRNPQLR